MSTNMTIEPTKQELIEIDRRTPAGNAWYIMGIVKKYMKEMNRPNEVGKILTRMMAGDYTNLCKIAQEETDYSIQYPDDVDHLGLEHKDYEMVPSEE